MSANNNLTANNNQGDGNLGSVTSGLLLSTSAIWLAGGNLPMAGAFAGIAAVRALSEGKKFKPVAFTVSTLAGIAAGLTLSFAMAAHNGAPAPSETQHTPTATQVIKTRAPAIQPVLYAKS